MATWKQFTDEAPELAEAIKARFTATKHHVLATLRADGSPRVSGTEVSFYGSDVALGSMWQAKKAHDLRRDGRCAIHSNPGDGSMAGGDAKLSGRAVELPATELTAFLEAEFADREAPPEPFHLFRVDLTDAVLTELGPDQKYLLVRLWRPGHGVRRFEVT